LVSTETNLPKANFFQLFGSSLFQRLFLKGCNSAQEISYKDVWLYLVVFAAPMHKGLLYSIAFMHCIVTSVAVGASAGNPTRYNQPSL